jgi:hypothetical protein
MELPALELAHFAERRVADDLPNAAAQLHARHWWSLHEAARVGHGRQGGFKRRRGPTAPSYFWMRISSGPTSVLNCWKVTGSKTDRPAMTLALPCL